MTYHDRILELLDLGRRGPDDFVAPTPSDGPGRLFGGQVASQSLRAATLTVEPGRPPHSLHAYFIRPGRPGIPLRLSVDRTRDGRSFTTRRVTASQDGEPIFTLAASFHGPEEGEDWQLPGPTDVPGPGDDRLPPSPFARFASMSPFDVRPVRAPAGEVPVLHPFWVRTKRTLPDDPALHACVLAFISDMGVVSSARAPGSPPPTQLAGASLDHAMWFHRPARADDWLLFDVEPVTNAGARGLARGSLHTVTGVLVASIAQEALLRGAGSVPLA